MTPLSREAARPERDPHLEAPAVDQRVPRVEHAAGARYAAMIHLVLEEARRPTEVPVQSRRKPPQALRS